MRKKMPLYCMQEVPGFTASVAEYVRRGFGGGVCVVHEETSVGFSFVMRVKS